MTHATSKSQAGREATMDATNNHLKQLLFTIDKTLGQKMDEIVALKATLNQVSAERDYLKWQYEIAQGAIRSLMKTVDAFKQNKT